jgi:hypothetical protein
MIRRCPPLYPFLAAAYPVLALAAANGKELGGLWVVVHPLIESLGIAVAAWLVWSLFVRNQDRRAFLTLVVIVLYASYGHLTLALGGLSWAAPYVDTALPLTMAVAYLAAITFLVLRLVPNLANLSRYMSVLTVILLVWATTDLLRHTAKRAFTPSDGPAGSAIANLEQRDPGPDIYLIVLDKYTGRQSLKQNFEFDNVAFETFLSERAFVLPRSPHANYIHTALSLASLLNYQYLDEQLARGHEEAYVNNLVEDNAVWRFLRARSYRFIFFPTSFQVTGSNRFASMQLPDPSQIPTEFEIVWRRTTLAWPVLQWACERVHCAHAFALFSAEGPELLEWKFDQLERLPSMPRDGRPLFVFAHIMSPHEPYVFNADCSHRSALWPSYSVSGDETPERRAYLAQLACVNRRLEIIVERILRDSPHPPVILLQSDHGHGRMGFHIPEASSVTPDRLAERADIFAAYYLPGADPQIVSDSITPVNVFRVVFRHYFQADLNPLPDETYWSPQTAQLKLTRITPR